MSHILEKRLAFLFQKFQLCVKEILSVVVEVIEVLVAVWGTGPKTSVGPLKMFLNQNYFSSFHWSNF